MQNRSGMKKSYNSHWPNLRFWRMVSTYKTVQMGSKFNILILCVLIHLPSSQPRPIERPDFDFNRTRSLQHGNLSSSSAIVRVRASSSSSVGHGGHSYHQRTIHHQPQPPTPSPLINFQPTTYHPHWHHLFHSPQREFQHHTFLRPPLELRQPGFHFLNRSLPPPPPPPTLSPSRQYRTEYFPLFAGRQHEQRYHQQQQVANHKSPGPLTTSLDVTPSSASPLEPIVSVVSSSHTVSAASESASTSLGEQRVSFRKSIKQDPPGEPRRDWAQSKVQKRRIVTRVENLREHRRRSDTVDDDTDMFQGDQPQDQPSMTTQASRKDWEDPTEKVWGEPEKVWGEPEKVWGEPEKVWGEPEKVWAEPEQVRSSPERNWESAGDEKWESQKELPEVSEEGPTDAGADVRFYELGEDEEDEPKELVLDKMAMEATIETAQLAARSWELPELSHHLSLVPPESLVRSSSGGAADRMAAESIQIPFRTNPMPKVRLTLEGGGAKAKSIPSDPAGQEAAKVQFQEGKKFGYVLDGSKVRKYRVEERTPDGFIVGEYGVLNHNNGFLRGVRYTADGSINPRLIHEALMKFLSL